MDAPGLVWLAIVPQLVFLEGVLSLDNAAVLGAMVAPLPDDAAVPWPRALRPLGRRLDPLLGSQRPAALKVGLLGAYAGRGLMLLLAHFILQRPWLRLLGGLYLVWLAADHLADRGGAERPERGAGRAGARGFWGVVLAVELADLAFSLDNVVAAVALSEHLAVVMLGVALGILLMRIAAGFFAALVQREPLLEPGAYALVLLIGALLVLKQLVHLEVPPLLQFGLSLAVLALALLAAHWRPLRRALRRLWRPARAALRLSVRLVRAVAFRPFWAAASIALALLREQ